VGGGSYENPQNVKSVEFGSGAGLSLNSKLPNVAVTSCDLAIINSYFEE
jgi:hypothetical protein